MDYRRMIEQIAQKEHVSENEIEKEMTEALRLAGISCSPEEFINQVARMVKQTIYRNIV